MAITVGLDFGTHQTKICIENSDDPNHKTYEFWDWGSNDFVLPSVIQINKNRTLAYGKIDMDSVLVGKKKKHLESPKPLVLPVEPIKPVMETLEEPILPPMPVLELTTEKGLIVKIPLENLYGIGKALPKSSNPKNLIKEWRKNCHKIEQENKQKLNLWNKFGKALGLPKPIRAELPPKPELPKTSIGNEGGII